MSRLIFPQDRIAYVYSAPGEPILMPDAVSITVYSNEGMTALADILDRDSHAVSGSVLYVGSDGLIPEFYGPADGTSVLWGRTPGGHPYQLDAQPGPRITAIELGGTGAGALHYTHVQGSAATTWSITHSLGYDPAGVVVKDQEGSVVIGGDIDYVSADSLTLTFSAAFSGTAYLS
jgi:hypothetical protein